MTEVATVPIPAVGQRLHSREEFHALPVGSKVWVVHNHDEWYRKVSLGDSGWESYTGDSFSLHHFSLSGLNEVAEVGDGQGPPPPPPETLLSVKTKFRDVVLRAANTHGVDRTAIYRAFSELGVGDEAVTVGSTLNASLRSGTDFARGTLIQFGDPSQPETYGLFEYRNRWTHIMGDVTRMPRGEGTIVRIGPETYDVPVWMTEDSDNPQIILDWRRQAWEVGRRVKKSTRWCGVLEETLARAGITANVVALAGPSVNREQAGQLPDGSILRWQHRGDPSEFMFFMRVDDSRSVARTRLVFGHRPSGTDMRNSMAAMTVAYRPDTDGEMDIAVPRSMLRYFPPGTVFSQGEGETYRVHSDGTISYAPDEYGIDDTGNYTRSSFTVETLLIKELPRPTA